MKYRKDTTDIVDDNGIDIATLWHGNRNEAARNALGHKMAAAEELATACGTAWNALQFPDYYDKHDALKTIGAAMVKAGMVS